MRKADGVNNEDKLRDYLKRAANDLRQAHQRIRELEEPEPVAIVGMACRFPGGVSSPSQLWELVFAGRDGVSDFPANRGWDVEGLFDPDPDARGKSYARRGGFLHDAGEFDAEFFGVSPREAMAMDPQQRLLLEVSWEAVESAGIDPLSLKGSKTGVYAGLIAQDYGQRPEEAPAELEGFFLAGNTVSVASGRVSYVLGLEGPALSIDTACSSSLVALHLAAQSLRRGECDLVLAGGVTVMAAPGVFTEFSRQRGLSDDGRCRAFGAGANGTGFGEGVGMLVVEKLSDARRNGHQVLAVVRGTAVNQDGASNGLTAPNGPSQERVIRQALADGGLRPSDVDVVEAHGTGTTLGDPIEAQALLATYGRDRAGEPLWLGSVKSNLAHTQAAAGVAGVIKMVEGMRRGWIPPTLHADEATPHVDWESGAVSLVTEGRTWPETGRPRRSAVSSFGISGTNAHVILEQGETADAPAAPVDGVVPWVLSGRSEEALKAAAARLHDRVAADPSLSVADIGLSLAGRSEFDCRAVVVGAERAELLAGLDAVRSGQAAANAVTGRTTAGRTAFLFPGQGSQFAGMSLGLYHAYPVFAAAFDEVVSALDTHLDRSLRDIVFAAEDSTDADSTDSGLLDETQYTQTALFAVEVALFRLLESWGVRPDALTGHSVGEITAAHVAGVLSLADATALVAARGRLMQALPTGGAMTAVAVAESEIRPLVDADAERVAIAAVNGPEATVISGRREAVDAVAAVFAERGHRVRPLRVSHAFHSPLMDDMLADFRRVAAGLSYQPPTIPVISNLTGEIATAEQLCSPDYWVEHVRGTVRFADGARALAADNVSTYLEVGPGAALSAMVDRCVGSEAAFAPTLRRGVSEPATLLTGLAEAYVRGTAADWPAVFGGGARLVDVPTYPFQHNNFWLTTSRGNGIGEAAGVDSLRHPLLGGAVELVGGGAVLTGQLSLRTHPWLADHTVHGIVILPGAALLDMALRAADLVGCDLVERLDIEQPPAVPPQDSLRVQVQVAGSADAGRREITISARIGDEGEWTEHATGTLAPSAVSAATPDTTPPAGAQAVSADDVYARLEARGFDLGPLFRAVVGEWRAGDERYAEFRLPEHHGVTGHFDLHPALIELAPQLIGPDDRVRLAATWRDVRLHATDATELRVRVRPVDADTLTLTATDAAGNLVAEAGAVVMRELPLDRITVGDGPSLFAVEWPTTSSTGRLAEVGLLGADESNLAEAFTTAGTRILAGADVVVYQVPSVDEAVATPAAVRATLASVAELARSWPGPARLVVVTTDAVAVADTDAPAPAIAPVWGLLRSAQSEHPGRFVLVDTDGSEASRRALPGVIGGAEPQLALRQGQVHVPRLARLRPSTAVVRPDWNPDGTVLITGATGSLGRLVARHLVTEHGVQRLLLVSRSGRNEALADELAALGATATFAACDAADRDSLAAVLAGVPAEHPLTGVVHTAGVLDDGVLSALTDERFDTVLRPKVDAAWHLHELTEHLPLAAFVLYSSVAATLGNAGQSNYAAANTFLDALAAYRRARGLPATALAWGLWGTGGMGEALSDARIAGSGLEPMTADQGLAAFDAAVAADRPMVVPARLDLAALRLVARAEPDGFPPLLKGLVRVATRRTGDTGSSLRGQLASLTDSERAKRLLALVRAEIATVLGYDKQEAIAPTRAFKDLGFDSLTAVRLRNRLNAVTGLDLPSTAVFDHPTPSALADFLLAELAGAPDAPEPVAPRGQETAEPIAIIGIGCRYPGGVASPEQLWDLVATGTDAISEFPVNRGWDLDGLYDPDPQAAGKTYARHGGFLHDADEFDPDFFGINPREAVAMDPQQRLLLETSWEALERAGIDPSSLHGSRTGVFAGVTAQDYAPRVGEIPEGHEGYFITGNTSSVASGRISYTFGFEGPAVTVDTACSSSLVALHLAAQSLRRGECDLALAGGVTVIASPGMFVEFSRQRGLSPDGRCRAFADSADGTGFAEGVGILAVERLSDAQRNGRRILAVLRGSAVNQDGASNGLTAPNGPSQQRVIRSALADAELSTVDIEAVEAHGTGTTLGDPIEAQALLATYGRERSADRPLWLGSVKSNLGHTQAAAGVAGVIKMVQAMRHGVLPRTLHVAEPSSHVDWSSGAVAVLTENTPWPDNGRPRRSAVSSFGISGTNAHVILEQAPEERSPAPQPDQVRPWVLSARSDAALRDMAARLSDRVLGDPDLDAAAVAETLATARTAFDHRAVVLGESVAELRDGLDALAAGEEAANVVSGVASPELRTVFVFPGQGSQWVGMALDLLDAEPVFRERLHECAAALESYVDWSLLDVLRGVEGAPSFDRVDVVQPVLFAVMVSLAALWRSLGVQPDAVIGHSQGEIAAACVAGALSLTDAARVVALRSQAIVALAGTGGMVSVPLPAEQVRERLRELGADVGVAAVNGPSSTVVSGDPVALDELVERCKADGIRARKVQVDYASHSPHVEALREQLLDLLADVAPRPAEIDFCSTVTGELHDPTTLDAAYWYENLRQTVEFEQATRTLAGTGHTLFIEVSPHPVLTIGIEETLDAMAADRCSAVGSLRRDDGGLTRMLTSLAQAHVRGATVHWPRPDSPTGVVDLPTYPFQRRSFWLRRTASSGDPSRLGLAGSGHAMLGAVVELGDGENGGVVHTGRLTVDAQPWLADHAVLGEIVLPGTAYVELAGYAGGLLGTAEIEELTLHAPLVLPEGGAVAIRVMVGAVDEDGRRSVTVHGRIDDADEPTWTRHADGVLAPAAGQPTSLVEWPPPGATRLDVSGLYAEHADRGLGYGPAFQGLRSAWRAGDDICAEIELPEGVAIDGFGLHPAALDSALHALGLVAADAEAGPMGARLPFSWRGIAFHGAGTAALRARLTPLGPDTVGLVLADAAGQPVAAVQSLAVRPVPTAGLAGRGGRSLFGVDWKPIGTARRVDLDRWAVLGDDPFGLTTTVPTRHADLDSLLVADAPEGVLVSFDGAAGPKATTHQALALVQRWLAEERLSSSTLVVVTNGAVATTADEDVPALSAAPIWGLLRSAQAEHPGRVVLVDIDGQPESAAALPAAAASGEPQLAIRDGRPMARRLGRLDPASVGTAPTLDPDGTVLITGATGVLGGLVARHLVATQGVRRLLLVSRSGLAAEGAEQLLADLTEAGAEAVLTACDVSDRTALAELLASIPADRPLTAVVHAAGALDDGVVASLTPERVDRVFAAKADAAWHLHELTADLDLQAFVLFSSVASTMGSPGQGNYSAANEFIDALAAHRRSRGLAGVSLAWGLWAQTSGLTAHLGRDDIQRMGRFGIVPLSSEQGLAMFDEAIGADRPLVVPVRLDRTALRRLADSGLLPPMLADLVPASAVAATRTVRVTLADRLAATADEAERRQIALDLVRTQAATVLGHADANAVDADRPFAELGFDSLTAVELRNRLNAASGVRLPATLVFDYPTPTALAGFIVAQAAPARAADARGLLAAVADIQAGLATLAADDPERAEIADRLRKLSVDAAVPTDTSTVERIWASSAAEVFDFIDNELGRALR